MKEITIIEEMCPDFDPCIGCWDCPKFDNIFGKLWSCPFETFGSVPTQEEANIWRLKLITDSEGFLIDVKVPEDMKDRVAFQKNPDGKVIWLKIYDVENFTWSDL